VGQFETKLTAVWSEVVTQCQRLNSAYRRNVNYSETKEHKSENPRSGRNITASNRLVKLPAQLKEGVVNPILLIIARNEFPVLWKLTQRDCSPVFLQLRRCSLLLKLLCGAYGRRQ